MKRDGQPNQSPSRRGPRAQYGVDNAKAHPGPTNLAREQAASGLLSSAPGNSLPKVLNFYIGPFDGGDWFEIKYTRGRLHFRAGCPFPVNLTRSEQCIPDPARWARFWEDIERIGVWNWRSDYSDPMVLDGGYWRLSLGHAGGNLKTGGDNGFPGSSCPEYPDGGEFDQLLTALENLTGIRGLRQ